MTTGAVPLELSDLVHSGPFKKPTRASVPTMTYSVVEIFKTLQGEGMYSGYSAIFVRFAGCDMWNGKDEDRERDAKLNHAECPKWCDTDFVSNAKSYTLAGLVEVIYRAGDAQLVVFTGGEPLLQLDEPLAIHCRRLGRKTCVETNGTVKAKPGLLTRVLTHICISPKCELRDLKLVGQMRTEGAFKTHSTELKVVYPAYDPGEYEVIRELFTTAYISPEAETTSRGVSVIQRDVEDQAAQFCLEHPKWALSLQTHKRLGLP